VKLGKAVPKRSFDVLISAGRLPKEVRHENTLPRQSDSIREHPHNLFNKDRNGYGQDGNEDGKSKDYYNDDIDGTNNDDDGDRFNDDIDDDDDVFIRKNFARTVDSFRMKGRNVD
jgi:hypothetical protein